MPDDPVPPHPCQTAYTNFRGWVLGALTRSRPSKLLNRVQSAARAVFLVLDVPGRWSMDIVDTFTGNRGYVAIGTILAAYFAVFGLIDAKSTQEETYASLERTLFITLVSSGNVPSFVAAMKDFGRTQTMRATEHPSWFRFWEWGRTYQPNAAPMRLWAVWRFPLCNQAAQDCSSDSKWRVDLYEANLHGADLPYAHLRDANLTGANLSGAILGGADLGEANLGGAHLHDANLTGANLSGAILGEANLGGADLGGADLRHAILIGADLRGAILTGANLSGAILRDTTPGGAELGRVADLRHAILRDARLDGQKQLDEACGSDVVLPTGLTLKPCPSQSSP